MPLIPPQVSLGLKLAAAGALLAAGFAGGWTMASWRASGELEAAKRQDLADTTKLQADWAKNMEAANQTADQARADLEVERGLNEQQRQTAEAKYAQNLAQRDAANDRLAHDAQRVRDELAAAQTAGRSSASGRGPVQQAGPPALCSGPGCEAGAGLLSRAIDLAERCAKAAGQQHAALVEAVDSWPKH